MESKEDKLKDVPECEFCKTASFLLANSQIKSGGEIGRMFYTISPDPELNTFGVKLPDSQKKSIDYRFDLCAKELNKHLMVYGYSIHYEFNKAGNLHTHGIVYIPVTYQDYNKWLVTASKLFNNKFGRSKVNSMISCRFEWIRDPLQTNKYVNKQNDYPARHVLFIAEDLTKYLQKNMPCVKSSTSRSMAKYGDHSKYNEDYEEGYITDEE